MGKKLGRILFRFHQDLNLVSLVHKAGVLTITPQSYMTNRAQVKFTSPSLCYTQGDSFTSIAFSIFVLIGENSLTQSTLLVLPMIPANVLLLWGFQ